MEMEHKTQSENENNVVGTNESSYLITMTTIDHNTTLVAPRGCGSYAMHATSLQEDAQHFLPEDVVHAVPSANVLQFPYYIVINNMIG